MESLLDPKSYRDPYVFEAEMERIFSSCWIYAGLRRDLRQDGDWIAFQAGSTAVTVQNDQGELRALHNICSHRFAVMRTQPKGSGTLKCPYHGWIYDGQGRVSAIPARPRFCDLDEKKISGMRLPSFTVECCGELVFVRLTPSGPSLREYCGGAWNDVKRFSEALGQQLFGGVFRVAANWKLVMENGIESYHSDCVHAETFGTSRSHQFKIQTGDHYARYEEGISSSGAAIWNRIKKKFASRPVELDSYTIYSLFPTFHIDTMRGVGFTVLALRPLNANETELDNRFFATRLVPPELEQSPFLRAYNESMVKTPPLIIEEDKNITENVQIGMAQARGRATLSEEEERLLAFQQFYKRYGF